VPVFEPVVSPGELGPLSGLIAADFSRVLAGPYLTMLLGDLGADVIKVERPDGGDDARHWGPPWDAEGRSTYFLSVNRNKRSLVLDLGKGADLVVARKLVAQADLVVENFRPGTMERLGLGYEELSRLHPRLVYCSISGFGAGEGRSLPGYDLLVQAVGGLMSVTGPGPDSPTKAGVALVDVLTGLHGAVAVLAALRERDRSGRGQLISLNLLSTLLSSLVNQASSVVMAGVVPEPMGNRHPSVAPYELLEAKDRPLALAVGNDRQFRALCSVIGRDDLAADPRFATNPGRVSHRDQLRRELEAVLARRRAADWIPVLSGRGIPCGPVNNVREALALADGYGLDPVVQLPRAGSAPDRAVADPMGLSRTPVTYRRAAPGLGEHTEEIRDWLSSIPG
jgi:crotonobetainyl-CoA:carnitine CoA-transferase CaiB-like acyl-CoA transferase